VQVIPHVTDEIKATIKKSPPEGVDVVIVEIGAPRRYRSLPFSSHPPDATWSWDSKYFCSCTYPLPFIAAAGELKTKTHAHSVKEMLSIGIQPDILLCRSDRTFPRFEKEIALVLQRRGILRILHAGCGHYLCRSGGA